MEATAHSSAPHALRGKALRAALRLVGCPQRDAPSSEDSFADAVFSARIAAEPIAFPEPPDTPDSAGPRALRPSELARWLERYR
jgi:hypothetical protein